MINHLEQDQTHKIHKEFMPRRDKQGDTHGGIINIWTDNHRKNLDKLDGLFDILAQDALQFEPPLQLTRDMVNVVIFGGLHKKGVLGLEMRVPGGHKVSDSYNRVHHLEYHLH